MPDNTPTTEATAVRSLLRDQNRCGAGDAMVMFACSVFYTQSGELLGKADSSYASQVMVDGQSCVPSCVEI